MSKGPGNCLGSTSAAEAHEYGAQVHLLLVRLVDHSTDLLISLNTPVFINPDSAAAEHAGAGSHSAHLAAPELFRAIVSTLRIVDYSMFGG